MINDWSVLDFIYSLKASCLGSETILDNWKPFYIFVLNFCLVMYKTLDKKVNVNFKIYDITDWKNTQYIYILQCILYFNIYCNEDIAQYLKK